jgi:hypothetical protein
MVVGVPIAGTLVSKMTNEQLRGVDFTRLMYVGSLLVISIVCLLNVRQLDAKAKQVEVYEMRIGGAEGANSAVQMSRRC